MDDTDWAQFRAELNAVRDRSYDALRRIEVHEATCSVRYVALARKLDLLFWIVGGMTVVMLASQGISSISNVYSILSKIIPLL